MIIGGGVSGLATAYHLGRAGISSVLLEKSTRLGGLIQTDVLQGCRLEAGPDSYLAAKPAVAELASELNELKEAVIGSNDARRRVFIVRAGKLVPFPAGMSMMVPGQWGPALRSELFGSRTKLRFLAETRARPQIRDKDISVGQLVSEHFGEEVLEYVADPLLAGVYGGNAASLSAASVLPRFLEYESRYGSLIRGVRAERIEGPKTPLFHSFRDGMQSLTDALANAISSSTRVVHAEATAVRKLAHGWQVSTAPSQMGNDEQLTAGQLVLACPAHVSAGLLQPDAPDLAAELGAIPYASSILVTLLYDSAALRHPLNGFGFLVPMRERKTIAAATWINTKFPTRVAPGVIAIRAFIVAEEAEKLLQETDARLAALVSDDLKRFMRLASVPYTASIRRWPRSMPQYVVGHALRQQKIARLLALQPSLHLVGNAYQGVGIPDCVRLAKTTAAGLAGIKTTQQSSI